MKYTVEVKQDDSPCSPREDDNLGIMVCLHRTYNLGDAGHGLKPSQFSAWSELRSHLIEHEKAIVILSLYIYDHSGITMSTEYKYPYNDRWDAGQVGFIYTTREAILKNWNRKGLSKQLLADAERVLRGEVELYDHYLTGDIYGYQVLDENGTVVSSCWGFYGQKECQAEGDAVAENFREADRKLHQKKLKAQIKSGAPLEKREAVTA